MARPSEWAIEVAARDYARRFPACLSRIMNAFSLIIIEGVYADTNAVPDDAQATWWLCGYLVTRDPQHWDTCGCGDFHFGAARRRLGADDQLHTCVDASDERFDEETDRARRRCKHIWVIELLRFARLVDLARANQLAAAVERDLREVLDGAPPLPIEDMRRLAEGLPEGDETGGLAA